MGKKVSRWRLCQLLHCRICVTTERDWILLIERDESFVPVLFKVTVDFIFTVPFGSQAIRLLHLSLWALNLAQLHDSHWLIHDSIFKELWWASRCELTAECAFNTCVGFMLLPFPFQLGEPLSANALTSSQICIEIWNLAVSKRKHSSHHVNSCPSYKCHLPVNSDHRLFANARTWSISLLTQVRSSLNI